jgi:predicted DsbA family dithiol-disulfide isomerase
MASKQVNLTVIYDLVSDPHSSALTRLPNPCVRSLQNCPFCYIGQKDIFSAIDEVTKQYNTLHFQVEFRPYVLHPSIKPGQPQDRATYCTNAFGQERAAACRKKFLERSKDVGLEV